jgi:hypothetical protein
LLQSETFRETGGTRPDKAYVSSQLSTTPRAYEYIVGSAETNLVGHVYCVNGDKLIPTPVPASLRKALEAHAIEQNCVWVFALNPFCAEYVVSCGCRWVLPLASSAVLTHLYAFATGYTIHHRKTFRLKNIRLGFGGRRVFAFCADENIDGA